MKPSENVVVDDPFKGPRIQGPVLNESIFPEDFWSSSTIEMENPGLYSQRSISNHALDDLRCTSSTGTSNPHEFVNHGKFIPATSIHFPLDCFYLVLSTLSS